MLALIEHKKWYGDWVQNDGDEDDDEDDDDNNDDDGDDDDDDEGKYNNK